MNIKFLSVLVVASFSVGAIPCYGVQDTVREEIQLVQALNDGINQWRREVSFACSYEYFLGPIGDKESALAGEVMNSPLDWSKGEMAKMGSDFRFTSEILTPAIFDANSGISTWHSFDIGVNEQKIKLVFLPVSLNSAGKRFGNSIRVDEVTNHAEAVFSIQRTATVNAPFFACGGQSNQTISLFKKKRKGKRPEIKITRHENEELTVRFELEDNGYHYTREVLVWTGSRLPMIKKNVFVLSQNGKLVAEHHVILANFVPVNDGLHIPAQCTVAIGPTETPDGWNWTTRFWKSKDLGEREPNEGDFKFTIPETTGMVNFHRRFKGETEIDLLALTKDDIFKRTKQDYYNSQKEKQTDVSSVPQMNPNIESKQ